MQDRPTAVELLEAMREFLEGEVLPELSGRRQFHMRVTINLLDILAREWDQEEDAARQEWAGLRELLDTEGEPPETGAKLGLATADLNRQLASRIRSGELDSRWHEVLAELQATARDKLRVANPEYLEPGDR